MGAKVVSGANKGVVGGIFSLEISWQKVMGSKNFGMAVKEMSHPRDSRCECVRNCRALVTLNILQTNWNSFILSFSIY